MDQTTFSDNDVRSYLKENFVSVKVDIDQFDGFALKEKYGVRYLPTIVILNPEGEVIGKMEEALAPAPFLEKLKGITQDSDVLPASTREKSVIDPEEKPQSPVRPVIPNTVETPEKPQHHLLLQFGVFKDEENAQLLAEKITTFLPSSPEISKVSRADGKTLYKVIYGPFETDSEAYDLKSDLESSGIESIIKPLE